MNEDLEARLQELVAVVTETQEWVRPDMLAAILAHGEAAVAPLIEVTRTRREDDPELDIPWYAASLLTDLHTVEAVEPIAELYTVLDSEGLEELGPVLIEFGPVALSHMLRIVQNTRLSWYPRAMASSVIVEIARDHPEVYEEALVPLREMLADYVARAGTLTDVEVDMVSPIVSDLSRVADPASRDLIYAAFDANIVDLMFLGREDVDERYARGGEEGYRPKGAWIERYRKRYRVHQQEEARMEALRLERQGDLGPAALPRPAALASTYAPQPSEPIRPVTVPRTPGRNDPCWCGSDKKYKKCHLDADAAQRRVSSDV